ncbi:MAG: hypothetical protein IJU45_03810 [Clostridia bacterium]|nr:hypothetical protein [Clostridia bacterium]
MIKKITSVLICVLIIAMSAPFAASAANSASFRVRLAEQTDKTATVVVEFAEGMGFGALDFEIKYNSLKLKLTEAKLGSGYKLFRDAVEEKGSQIIGSLNSESNPIKVSIATLESYEKVNNDGVLVRMAFSKIGGTKVSESDVKLTITNCQTTGLKDITASVSYDMNAASSQDNAGENVTAYPQRTSKDNMNDNGENEGSTKQDSEIGEPVSDESQTGADPSSSQQAGTADQSGTEKADDTGTKTVGAKATSNKTKTVAIVVVAVVLAGGTAALVYMIVNNKRKQEEEF